MSDCSSFDKRAHLGQCPARVGLGIGVEAGVGGGVAAEGMMMKKNPASHWRSMRQCKEDQSRLHRQLLAPVVTSVAWYSGNQCCLVMCVNLLVAVTLLHVHKWRYRYRAGLLHLDLALRHLYSDTDHVTPTMLSHQLPKLFTIISKLP